MPALFEAAVQLRANGDLMHLLERLMTRPLPYGSLHVQGQPTRRLLNQALRAGHLARSSRDYGLTRQGAQVLLKAHEIVPIEQSIAGWRKGQQAVARNRQTRRPAR